MKITIQVKGTAAQADDWCEAIIAFLINVEGVEIQDYWLEP